MPSHTSGSGEQIRLGQFLKLADAVELGSDVKLLLADGTVLVNGEVETRRGRQLVAVTWSPCAVSSSLVH